LPLDSFPDAAPENLRKKKRTRSRCIFLFYSGCELDLLGSLQAASFADLNPFIKAAFSDTYHHLLQSRNHRCGAD